MSENPKTIIYNGKLYLIVTEAITCPAPVNLDQKLSELQAENEHLTASAMGYEMLREKLRVMERELKEAREQALADRSNFTAQDKRIREQARQIEVLNQKIENLVGGYCDCEAIAELHLFKYANGQLKHNRCGKWLSPKNQASWEKLRYPAPSEKCDPHRFEVQSCGKLRCINCLEWEKPENTEVKK